MNPFGMIKCVFSKHDVSGSKSIVDTFDSNNWIKRCNCCGRYIMHGHLGSVSLSEKEAFRIKSEFDKVFEHYQNKLLRGKDND